MKAPVLVIMAAGMGSRFGGLKQIEPVSDKGEIRVFSLKMCTDTNNIRHAGVFEQKMDGKVTMHGSTQNPSMGSFLTRIFDIILGKA